MIPDDFDYQMYLQYNPDLLENGITNEIQAKQHYIMFGHKEKRVYKEETLIKDIDKDFDPVFYINEYPETNDYFNGVKNVSLNQKLLHHYMNYGRYEGRYKNATEKTKSLVDIHFNILTEVNVDDLLYIKNKLECICLLITETEIGNGSYDKFINLLIANTQPLQIYKSINFYIIINHITKQNINKLKSAKLKKIFRSVKIINLKLNKDEDCYIKHNIDGFSLPKYGLKSGPNITFLKTIELCKKYNTILLLETDCILSRNWLSKIINYTEHANGFLISGAMYDGLTFTKSDSPMRTHINGGTALYATHSKILQSLVKLLDIFIIKQTANNLPGLAYDYALKLLIDTHLDNTHNKPLEREIWKYISRNYLHCKAILNCSTISDSSMNSEKLYKQYSYAILHKK